MNNVLIIDGGEVSTPMFYFSVKKSKADFGLMITSSHLPENYNGLKICRSDLEIIPGVKFKKFIPLFEQKIEILRRRGQYQKRNFLNDYVNFLLKQISFSAAEIIYLKKLKIIIDCSGGTVGPILKKLLAKLPLKIKLAKLTKKSLIDFGAIFDEDGDRIIFTDSRSKKISADIIGALLVGFFLKKRRRPRVVVDERSTQLISKMVKEAGGKIIYSRVGHSFFKKKMRQRRALLGIEKSGHYYWRDFFFADAGLFTFLQVLKILAFYRQELMELVKQYQKYALLPEQNFKIKNFQAAMKAIEKKFKKSVRRISRLDGLTMEFKDWRFNLRPSQTEPYLRLNIEADNSQILKEKLRKIKKIISNF